MRQISGLFLMVRSHIYSKKTFSLYGFQLVLIISPNLFSQLRAARMPVYKCWQPNYKGVVTVVIVAECVPKTTSFCIQFLSKQIFPCTFSFICDVYRRDFVTVGRKIIIF